MKARWIRILVIINLFLLAIVLIGKIQLVHKFNAAIVKVFLIPLFVSLFIFYIVRPLNNIFIKKGIGNGRASFLTILICGFIGTGIGTYFGKYAYGQFKQIVVQVVDIINDKSRIDGYMNWISKFISVNELYSIGAGMARNYIYQIGQSFMKIIGYFMNTFSMVFLILVIVFYLLKDGHKFRETTLSLIPEKYKRIANEILSEGDTILSHYVTGQAKVALALAIMIYTGYKIIGMSNAMILSIITFVLAFIPFVGFFISMIIPTVIALGIGLSMFVKLMVLFVIVQTLKGRVVVPAIMAKTMNIHPLTDIFLVIGAIAVGGPLAAFVVVPVYALAKNVIISVKK